MFGGFQTWLLSDRFCLCCINNWLQLPMALHWLSGAHPPSRHQNVKTERGVCSQRTRFCPTLSTSPVFLFHCRYYNSTLLSWFGRHTESKLRIGFWHVFNSQYLSLYVKLTNEYLPLSFLSWNIVLGLSLRGTSPAERRRGGSKSPEDWEYSFLLQSYMNTDILDIRACLPSYPKSNYHIH